MFTTYTEVQYDQASWDTIVLSPVPPLYVDDCVAKAQIMKDEGKTPEVFAELGSLPRSYRRYWIDTTSAEEWKTFQLQKASDYSFVITDYIIGQV